MELKLSSINFRYDANYVFKDLNISFKHELVFVIGNNNSGKTTLFNIVNGTLPYDGEISVNNKDIRLFKDKLFLNKNYINSLKGRVRDYLGNVEYKTIEFLNIDNFLDDNFNDLEYAIKVKICLAYFLLNDFSILFIDNLLCWLNKNEKNLYLKKLKSLSKNKIIVVITNNIEDVLYGKRVILLNEGIIVKDDSLGNFFSDKKLLDKYKVNLPFIVDLSYNLRLYNIVDDVYFDIRKLVDDIWK